MQVSDLKRQFDILIAWVILVIFHTGSKVINIVPSLQGYSPCGTPMYGLGSTLYQRFFLGGTTEDAMVRKPDREK